MGDCFKSYSCWSQSTSSNMVLQVQEETLLYNQVIQGTIFCDRGFPEETVSWTLELVFSGGTVVHSEVDVYFTVYYRFVESNY